MFSHPQKSTFMVAIVVAAIASTAMTDSATGGRTSASRNVARTPLKVRRVNWTDVQTLNTGGRVVYHTTKITTAGEKYTIALSVTNHSDNAVELMTYPPKDQPSYIVGPESFGIAYREPPNPNITTRRLINSRARTFSPALPQSLQPGESWQGTFSGTAHALLKHRDWWIVFGMVVPGGYWVSDRTFST